MEPTSDNKRRSIKIKAFGVEVEIRGYDIILVLIVGALVALGTSQYYVSEAFATDHKAIRDAQTAITTTQAIRGAKNEEQLNEIIYILSLSEKERAKLELAIPKSMLKHRIMVNRREN